MIFSAWKAFSFIYSKTLVEVFLREHALHTTGIPVDLAKIDKSEILDSLKYETDPAKKAVLQSYL